MGEDETRLGTGLRKELPEETGRVDEAFDRLAHPDYSVRPENLAVDDPELLQDEDGAPYPEAVQQLAERNARLVAALVDFRDHGIRADVTPAMSGRTIQHTVGWFYEYLASIDRRVRERAAQALQAAPGRHLAICDPCGVEMPFRDQGEQFRWATAHVHGTGHPVHLATRRNGKLTVSGTLQFVRRAVDRADRN